MEIGAKSRVNKVYFCLSGSGLAMIPVNAVTYHHPPTDDDYENRGAQLKPGSATIRGSSQTRRATVSLFFLSHQCNGATMVSVRCNKSILLPAGAVEI